MPYPAGHPPGIFDTMSTRLFVSALLLSSFQAFGQLEVPLLPIAKTQPTDWQYTFEAPAIDWYASDFDASSWFLGPGGFGTEGTPNATLGTTWSSSDIWMRKGFTLAEDAPLENLSWKIHHDEAVQIYLNGTLVYQATEYTTDYKVELMMPDAVAALKPGANVIAVHCSQTDGGQYIDVGMVSARSVDLVEIVPDSRVTPQDWAYTMEDPATSSWMTGNFSTDTWFVGKGGFGNVLPGMDASIVAGTAWTSGNIWLRRTFTLPDRSFSDFFLNIFYDEAVEVFLNGTLVYSRTGFVTGFKQETMEALFLSALKPGENILAVHCAQTTGGQYIDIGISAVEGVPVGLARTGSWPKGEGRVQVRRGRSAGMGVFAPNLGRGGFYDFNGRWSPNRR